MLRVQNLIGFGAGGVVPLTTLSQVLSATAAESTTITAPVGIAAGDLLVLWDGCFRSPAGAVTSVMPSGFNSIADFTNGTDQRNILSYKIAAGTEGGTSLTGMTHNGSTLFADKALYVFRGNVGITLATPTDVASEVTNGNPAAQTVNASGAAVPLVVIAGYYAGVAVSPRTFTVGGSAAKDGEISPTGNFEYLAYKLYNSSPADVVCDMDDESVGNALCSCYIVCS